MDFRVEFVTVLRTTDMSGPRYEEGHQTYAIHRSFLDATGNQHSSVRLE